MNKSLLSIILMANCIAATSCLYSQGENNHWIFGFGCQVSFAHGSLEILPALNTLATEEGCATVSDKNGALLFYSDGITIWNKNHKTMLNGSGLLGDPSSTSSCVIVPFPGHPYMYYVFCVDANFGNHNNQLTYNIVDLKQDFGLGKVILKNRLLMAPSDEKIAVTRHCNSKDFWIMTHRAKSALYQAYLLTELGLIDTPVISKHPASYSHSIEIGYLKFSPDGNCLVNTQCHGHVLEVYSFDKTSGKLSLYAIDTKDYHYDGQAYYGLAFSTNSQFLYVSCLDDGLVYQYNLNLTPLSIFKERVLLFDMPNRVGALQLASDSRIYISNGYRSKTIHCILKPDEQGNACLPKPKFIVLNAYCNLGLPTYVESLDKYFSLGKDSIIDLDRYTLKANVNAGKYLWSTGENTQSIEIYASGSYWVNVYDQKNCFLVRDTINIRLLRDTIRLTNATSFSMDVCSRDSIQYPIFKSNNKNNIEYQWTCDNPFTGLSGSGIGQIPQGIAPDCDSMIISTITVIPFIHQFTGEPYIFKIRIHPKPHINPVKSMVICSDEMLMPVHFTVIPRYTNLRWDNNTIQTGIPESGVGDIPSVRLKRSRYNSTSTITAIAELDNCLSDPIQFNIVSKASPNVLSLPAIELCAGEVSKAITIPVWPNNSVVHWNSQSHYLNDSGTGIIPEFISESSFKSESFNVYYRTELEGCTGDSGSIQFLIHPKPHADIQFIIDTAESLEDEIKIQFYSLKNQTDYLLWDFKDGQFSEVSNPIYIFDKTKTHSVLLTIETEFGCKDSDLLSIPELKLLNYFIPNAFSPGENTINKTFRVYGTDGKNAEFSIFNRWGQLIYHSTENKPWDGTYQGNACEEGVYVYRVKINGNSEKVREFSGTLTLLR